MSGHSRRHRQRLILVDGLAGVGKSTTAQRLWIHLRAHGHDAVWFHEHDSRHPIFYFSDVDELPRLVSDALWDQIVARWKALARNGGAGPIRVLEGSLFQTSVGVLLSQNVGADSIKAMVLMIAGFIRELNPAVVYLRLPDTSAWLSRNIGNRGQRWVHRMTNLLAQTPYGRERASQGVGTLIEFYRDQQRVIESIFGELPLEKTAIEVSDNEWATSYRQIAEFLGTWTLLPLEMPADQLLRFIGSFRGVSTGAECTIEARSGSLFISFCDSEPAVQLLPVMPGSGEFCLMSLPVTIQFDCDDVGGVRGFACDVRARELRLSDITWRIMRGDEQRVRGICDGT